jgi:hypothetical protein
MEELYRACGVFWCVNLKEKVLVNRCRWENGIKMDFI